MNELDRFKSEFLPEAIVLVTNTKRSDLKFLCSPGTVFQSGNILSMRTTSIIDRRSAAQNKVVLQTQTFTAQHRSFAAFRSSSHGIQITFWIKLAYTDLRNELLRLYLPLGNLSDSDAEFQVLSAPEWLFLKRWYKKFLITITDTQHSYSAFCTLFRIH